MRAYVVGALVGWFVGFLLLGGLLNAMFGVGGTESNTSAALNATGGVVGVFAGLFGGHVYLSRRSRETDTTPTPDVDPDAEEGETVPAWFGRAFLAFLGFAIFVYLLGLLLGTTRVDETLEVTFRFGAIAFWYFIGLSILVAAGRASGVTRYLVGGVGWAIVAFAAAASLANVGVFG